MAPNTSHSKVLDLRLQLINMGVGWHIIQPVTRAERNPLLNRGTFAVCTHLPRWPQSGMPNVEDICLQSPSQLRVDRKSDLGLVWKCFHSAPQEGISGHSGALGAKEQNQKAKCLWDRALRRKFFFFKGGSSPL